VGDLGGLLSTALAIVAIATLAGLGLLRGTVTNLREQLRDEREARAADRQQKADDDIEHAQFKADTEAKIAKLEAELQTWRAAVTGEVHWVAIEQRIEDLIKMLMTFGKRLEDALTVVRRRRAKPDDE
jgi:hypothetical protein